MTQGSNPVRGRVLRMGAVGVLALSGVVAAFATIGPAPDADLFIVRSAVLESLAIDHEQGLMPAPRVFIREERFQRGDTHASLLSRLGVTGEDATRALRARVFWQLRTGSSVTAQVDAEGALLGLSYLSGRETLVRVEPDGERFQAGEESAPLETHVARKAGTIRSSLFVASDTAGIPDSVAIQFADVFGGDIDFHRDLRKGDRFSVVYEQHYVEGREVHTGRVLAAEFLNQGKRLRAVYFEDADGKGGYYAPDGKNLRKAFLRSPLQFSRVSSGFGMRRHPFLKDWRAHQGVDYAAPPGTLVRSVGDGVVELAGIKGGYGKVVIIRHQGHYSTLYAHLRGFASDVRRGTRVSQGETIGFVGQTGWATGPHLHYEFRIAGAARNPLAISLPAALPVPKQELAAFRVQAERLDAQLDLLADTNLALLE